MKKIRKYVLIFVVAVVVAIVGLMVLVSFYEDEVIAYAVERIEENLVSDMQVGSIDLTLLETFPKASIRLKSLVIEDTFTPSDTLIAAESAFLELSMWDFVKGIYTVQNVHIEEGQVYIKRSSNGDDNFHFWKSGNQSGGVFSFEVKGVSLDKVAVLVEDDRSGFFLDLENGDFRLSGAFDERNTTLSGKGDCLINRLTVDKETYLSRKQVSTRGSVRLSSEDNAYYFSDNNVTIEGLPFLVSGSLLNLDKSLLCDLSVSGKELPIRELTVHLPESYKKITDHYPSSGMLNFDGTITGNSGDKMHPDVIINYTIMNGEFEHRETGVSISDIEAKGSFEKLYGSTEKIEVVSLSGLFGKGSFQTSGVVSQFDNPQLNVVLKGNFDLDDLRQFAQMNELESLNGKFSIDGQFSGALYDGGKVSARTFQKAKISGETSFENASFKLKSQPHTFYDLTGNFQLQGNDALVNYFTGKVLESDFSFKGYFRNLMAYLALEGQQLEIDAAFYSSNLDFTPLLSTANSNAEETAYHLEFPKHLSFHLEAAVDQFAFREFEAHSLTGKAHLEDQILTFEPLRFGTADGTFSMTGRADGRADDSFVMSCEIDLNQININRLFEEFENFGQTFLTGDNLKGMAKAKIDFSAQFDTALRFDADKIKSTIDIQLVNGELINLTSMENIGAYIRKNPLVAPFVDEDALDEKLRHIHFSTLANRIEINNGLITIPEMEIYSSALDITASGTHSFQNNIEYSIGFYLRDLIAQKNSTEFGKVEDDGLGNSFFLSMKGNVDNPEFGYDRLAHKDKRKRDRQAEKDRVRNVLKSQFGNEPDSLIQETGITIHVEDSEAVKNNNGPKKSLKDLLKRNDKNEDEEEVIIEFEDDDF